MKTLFAALYAGVGSCQDSWIYSLLVAAGRICQQHPGQVLAEVSIEESITLALLVSMERLEQRMSRELLMS